MKQILIYSLILYTIIFILLLYKKPSFLYKNNKLKSFNFFKKIINNPFNYNVEDFILNLLTINIVIIIISFIIAYNISSN
jgi:hypothetical protein